jgi:hypothetical protein
MLWFAWAVALAVAPMAKKSSGGTATNRTTQRINR